MLKLSAFCGRMNERTKRERKNKSQGHGTPSFALRQVHSRVRLPGIYGSKPIISCELVKF